MFEKIRKPGRAKNIFAYIIFFLICLVFVFLGVPVDPLSGGGGFAALVNKQVISWADLSERTEQFRRQSKNSMGQNNAESQKEDTKRALNQLINEELVFQQASQASLLVSDKELRNTIINIPAFQKDGVFKNSIYRSFLNARRISASDFENKIRKWVLAGRAERLFDQALFISQMETAKNDELKDIQLQLSYVRIPLMQDSSDELNSGRLS